MNAARDEAAAIAEARIGASRAWTEIQVIAESLLAFVAGRSYGASLIRIGRGMFGRFCLTVVSTFKDNLGARWTAETETA